MEQDEISKKTKPTPIRNRFTNAFDFGLIILQKAIRWGVVIREFRDIISRDGAIVVRISDIPQGIREQSTYQGFSPFYDLLDAHSFRIFSGHDDDFLLITQAVLVRPEGWKDIKLWKYALKGFNHRANHLAPRASHRTNHIDYHGTL